MTRVEILRLGAKQDRKHIGAVGKTVEVEDGLAKTLISYAMAKPAGVDEPGKNPADNRETATADKRETRAVVPQA